MKRQHGDPYPKCNKTTTYQITNSQFETGYMTQAGVCIDCARAEQQERIFWAEFLKELNSP